MKTRSGPRRAGIIPLSLLLLALVPLIIMPLAAIYIFAGKAGWSGFFAAVTSPDAQFAIRFSILVAFATTAVNAVIGTFTAYMLSKYRFRGRGTLNVIVTLPVAIPTVVVGTSLLLLWGPIGLLGQVVEPLGMQPMFSFLGILLAHLFVSIPYMLGAVKPVLDELESTYEEAAHTMGANRWQVFRYVLFPALRGGLLTGAILTFAHSLGEFGATVLVSGNLRLRTQTAPLYIFSQFEAGNVEAASAVAAVLATLSFVIFILLLHFTRRSSERRAA